MSNTGSISAAFLPTADRISESTGSSTSHHGWLRELERAQASMFKQQPSGQRNDAPVRPHDHAALETDSRQKPIDPNSAEDWLPSSRNAVDGASRLEAETGVRTAMPGTTTNSSTDRAPLFGASYRAPQADAVALRAATLTTGSVPKELVRYSSSTLNLMQTGPSTCDVALRDKSMTLESELELVQLIRSNLRKAGLEMGQLWLNGKLRNQNALGDEHGS